MKFNLKSDYSPTGDQPEAIADLVQGINDGIAAQTLLGVTGSGKTFAFGLPTVEYLRKMKFLGTRRVQAIVLAPTRELAI